MRCQYCGKRLPLFRKLKDGEFCSAAHRAQFLAQTDQMGLAALQQQRERVLQARQKPAKPAAPASQGDFCDRFLPSEVRPLPLRQLAGVPLERAGVAIAPFLPEHATAPTPAAWTLPDLQAGLPADQVLSALNDVAVPAEGLTPAVEPVTKPAAVDLSFTQNFAELTTAGMFAPDAAQNDDTTAALSVPAQWFASNGELTGVRLNLAPDQAQVVDLEEPPARQTCLPLRLPTAYAPAANLIGMGTVQQTVQHFAVRCLNWMAQPARTTAARRLRSAGLEPLVAQPVASATLMPVAIGAYRHPQLAPTYAVTFPRARYELCLAPVAGPSFALNARLVEPAPTASGTRPIAVLTPDLLLEHAQERLSGRLEIQGELADLVRPSGGLAPPSRLAWRHEPIALNAIRTLAVRPLPMAVERRWPARPQVTTGPRRSDQLLRLNSIVRPARYDRPAGDDALSFHLEPRVVQPRLRANPDPARQGVAGFKTKGKNQADAAVSSIKIPVLRRFWDHAPADIRWVALIIPLVFFLAWYSWTPNGKALNRQAEKADLAVDTSGMQTVLASFKSRIASRAAVELGDDFRAGLGEWQGARPDWAENWSYDQAGFVRPGSLALFTPTMTLHDYTFEFMGQIESRGMSWVYRATDAKNYYLGKLVVVQGGPVPEIALVRSVVKNGRESKRKQVPLPATLRADTLYRVRVEVNGNDFTTSVLGQVVDTFTDPSHAQGGIGFYGGHGEMSRIRWVEVSHQYDTLGRLCAMLVPYGVSASSVAPPKAVGQ